MWLVEGEDCWGDESWDEAKDGAEQAEEDLWDKPRIGFSIKDGIHGAAYDAYHEGLDPEAEENEMPEGDEEEESDDAKDEIITDKEMAQLYKWSGMPKEEMLSRGTTPKPKPGCVVTEDPSSKSSSSKGGQQ
jgi:hypothetical protein